MFLLWVVNCDCSLQQISQQINTLFNPFFTLVLLCFRKLIKRTPPTELSCIVLTAAPCTPTLGSELQEVGKKEHLWQTAALSWDMEVWAGDNRSPNVSLLCKQIPPIGPIQNSMKNHRRQISLSKPLCEREDWKDMKALACILGRLSFDFSYLPFLPPCSLPTRGFAQHALIWGVLWLSQPWWRAALHRSESSAESCECPCLCSL